MILSILICSINSREAMLQKLLQSIPNNDNVEILTEVDNREITTGAKRNSLLKKASGEYIVFVDDDDIIYPHYLPEILKAIEQKPDAVGFKGWITFDGKQRKEFRISKNYSYRQAGNVFFRPNNHISPVKREYALQIGFPDLTFGEDTDYATRLQRSGLVKTEVFINKFLYHYDYKTNK